MTKKILSLDSLAKQILSCESCSLFENRIRAVPGDGKIGSQLLFVGEAPGKSEDMTGIPFVGSSGKMLSQLLKSINLSRENVFITNIVKCRPPNNRDPLSSEIRSCASFLNAQIRFLSPKIVITLGRHAMYVFLKNQKIGDSHGKEFQINDSVYGNFLLFPVYHPAAALYNPNLRSILFEDFAKIPTILKRMNI